MMALQHQPNGRRSQAINALRRQQVVKYLREELNVDTIAQRLGVTKSYAYKIIAEVKRAS